VIKTFVLSLPAYAVHYIGFATVRYVNEWLTLTLT